MWTGDSLVSQTVSKWKTLEQMVNSMYRVTDAPSWPFLHPGVMQLLDGGQQTASESLTSAENMLDLVPERRRGRLYKPGWTVR